MLENKTKEEIVLEEAIFGKDIFNSFADETTQDDSNLIEVTPDNKLFLEDFSRNSARLHSFP